MAVEIPEVKWKNIYLIVKSDIRLSSIGNFIEAELDGEPLYYWYGGECETTLYGGVPGSIKSIIETCFYVHYVDHVLDSPYGAMEYYKPKKDIDVFKVALKIAGLELKWWDTWH